MRLSDDYDKNNESRTSLPLFYMTVGVCAFFVLIVCAVFMMNYSGGRGQHVATANHAAAETTTTAGGGLTAEEIAALESASTEITGEAEEATEQTVTSSSTMTADDLDFWDMYKEESDEEPKSSELTKSERYEENAKALMEDEELAAEEEDLSEGGKKTMVTLPDGTEQWVMINANIPKHTYDFTGLVLQDSVMRYYDKGKKASFMGVDVNETMGEINFEKVKRAGVDFVMVEMISRGYSTGSIIYDDYYYANIENTIKAGLDVGVIVNSQAMSEAEAIEEAQIVLDNLVDFHLTYPIVFSMEMVTNDSSRIEKLTKTELTAIARAFCKKIEESGYTAMIKGDKYWLLRKLDLTSVPEFDIWLTQEADAPDYPYQFAMWQYSQKGEIDGIDAEANVDICFIDYGKR